MLTVYLFCLAVGGGFLALSLFGDALDGADVEADLGVDADPGEIDGTSAWAQAFSLRSVVYALFGFGASGSLLRAFGATGGRVGVEAAIAAGTGLGIGALVSAVFAYMRRTESGALPSGRSFVGKVGEVSLEIAPGSPGVATVRKSGRRVRVRARVEDDADAPDGGVLKAGRPVVVVDVKDGLATVSPVEAKLLEE